MKTDFTFVKILALGLVLSSPLANAADKGGNGGDICESRIEAIRDDIGQWIRQGSCKRLRLPEGIAIEDYSARMLAQVASARISCVDETLMVGATEKTCMNFVEDDGTPRIVCNVARFSETSESDQYVLLHHEYAGLAGLEVNHGEESMYPMSSQISGFLADSIVKKLVIKNSDRWITLDSILGTFAGSTGRTRCSVTIEDRKDSAEVAFIFNFPEFKKTRTKIFPETEVLDRIQSRNIDDQFYKNRHSIFIEDTWNTIPRKLLEIQFDAQGAPSGATLTSLALVFGYGQYWCDHLTRVVQ